MRGNPVVSVCIPTYRGTAYLGAAIESVLAQTYRDFELVVIDNHSRDGTAALVQQYSDERIRFIENATNIGAEGNFNKCLAEARGNYVKLLPHDDLLMPRCLERQVGAFEQDVGENLALVFCARLIINAAGRRLHTRRYPGGTLGVIPARDVLRKCLRYGTNLIGEPGGVIFRRELARRVGFFDASQPYVIDLDYWFRMLLNGDAYYVPEPLAAFRVSPQSWSADIGGKQSADFGAFIDKIMKSPAYGVSTFDAALGRVMAQANNIGRMMFYKLAARL